MRRRTFLQAMAGAAGAVTLGACKSDDRSTAPSGRPTIRLLAALLGYPSPFTYTAGPGYLRMSLLFDTLTWPDSTGEQLPWLASSYERTDDGLGYRVNLREAAWADGRPLTARDVAFTYEYFASHTFTPLLIGIPRNVAEVKVTGERSLEFRLERTDTTFVQHVLGTVPIAPEHVWSNIRDPMAADGPEALIGTGPYTLASRDETAGTESYEANERYFLGRPFVRRIQLLPAADPFAALRVGDIDASASPETGVTNPVLAPFRGSPDYGMVSRQAGAAFPLFFNMTRGGALADVRFRRACLHAIDREDMVQRLLTGNGQVGSQGWLPPSNPYHDPGVRAYPFDRAEAERLLDEGGYRRSSPGATRVNTDGSPLRYTLYIPEAVPVAVAELIANSLKAVGVDIDLQVIDLVRLFGAKLQKSYDMLVTLFPGPAGAGPGGDPEILRGVYYTDPPNPFHKATGYSNPEVDRLLDAQLGTYDVPERKRLVGQIQRIVAEDLPAAMLYYTNTFFIFKKGVFDQWYYTPGGFGPGIGDIYNKHPYVTGRQKGLEVRKAGS